MITLRKPTLAECQQVRIWRNDPAVLPMLRTGAKTARQQGQFYRRVICNPESEHKYFALVRKGQFIGLGGLTYMHRRPGEAEISLLLGPEFRGQGLGAASVVALLRAAVGLRLSAVIGECLAGGAVDFGRRWVGHGDQVGAISN